MTFARICATFLALTAVAQAALVINQVNIVGNGTSFIIFTSTDPENDPTSVTIELQNPVFNSQFAVGNNVNSNIGNFSFQTPSIIPGPDYTIQLVNNNNASDIFAMSTTFTVTERDVTSSSSKLSASSTPTLPPTLGSTPTTPATTPPSSAATGATQSGSSSSSGSPSFSAPPASTSNPVFSGATELQVPLGLLLSGVAFAFL